MCGILAIFGDINIIGLKSVMRAYNVLKSRGPDRGVVYIKDNDILAFRRLCIMDKSEIGDQPFISGKISVMCNGEIYNHKELEKEYDLKCISGSDCECILLLYKKLGFEKTVSLLDGVYAIVIKDGDTVYYARPRS